MAVDIFAVVGLVIGAVGLVIGVAGFIFGIYQRKKRKDDAKEIARIQYDQNKAIVMEEQEREIQTVEDKYKIILENELNRIGMAGPEFDTKFLSIEESFVSLRLSQSKQCEKQFDKEHRETAEMPPHESEVSPEKVMQKAFKDYRLLLVIGEPGSGKTTLLHFYAVTCLENNHHRLGFAEKSILPLYVPLRELRFSNGAPLSLQENLSLWSGLEHETISPADFKKWLERDNALVLLDGLDEISDRDRRRQVSQWVKRAVTTFKNARFVLTSRPTGYRKRDGIELEDCLHLRADILDFSPLQQALFLKRWFHAVYPGKLPDDVSKEQRDREEKKAEDRSRTIIDFLNKEENKSIRELARVPMLLQIMAILWKDRDYLPGSRGALYDISLNYLLGFRDDLRHLKPLLSPENARIVLGPAARWMLETEKRDFAAKTDIYQRMDPYLKDMPNAPDAPAFCENLRDRAGLIADYGIDSYIFRHKSFMEFLAAAQLVFDCKEKHKSIDVLVNSFKDEWWEEPLLFFICKADRTLFNRFMLRFFKSKVSRDLPENKQTLLENMVREAPQRNIDGMVQCLNSGKLNENQKRYILNCLKIIDTPESIGAVNSFLNKTKGDNANRRLAGDIVAELGEKHGLKIEKVVEEIKPAAAAAPNSFRNPFEDNVEYIKIPGGTYTFSVSKKTETVTDIYFCKYPVTNKRYRRFISYLEGKQTDLEQTLPFKLFSETLPDFAKDIKGYTDYLGPDPGKWKDKFRSRLDDDKRFNGDDQPVVGVSWYGARAYCFWLTGLRRREVVYRLPTEVEWEWAAAGREPDGSLREYPWDKSKGDPNTNLANYGGEVGATTPVGRYPDGATPEGLMDMAGNVWEWMGNFYDKDKGARALRGGSWYSLSDHLRCVSRHFDVPDDYWNHYGFRVVALPAPSHTS